MEYFVQYSEISVLLHRVNIFNKFIQNSITGKDFTLTCVKLPDDCWR